ncbi:hypothetical protein Y1Q_0014470 [Alligator mississippiensis]|uniref:Uncharacterized protein n=1 Tax=Alligator mississippiensis TaxID=8496 RepID=A0A151PCX5_ALLMI|nr:hypothetical protein Y1Q_0014470 [Alligator mississippiensis]
MPHRLALDHEGGVHNMALLPAINVQGGALGDIEAQAHPPSCLSCHVQHLLQLGGGAGEEDKVISVGQDAQLLDIQLEPTGPAHCNPKEQFHGQVKNDGSEWAALSHSKNRYYTETTVKQIEFY